MRCLNSYEKHGYHVPLPAEKNICSPAVASIFSENVTNGFCKGKCFRTKGVKTTDAEKYYCIPRDISRTIVIQQ